MMKQLIKSIFDLVTAALMKTRIFLGGRLPNFPIKPLKVPTLKMEALLSSEASVHIHQSKLRNVPEDLIRH